MLRTPAPYPHVGSFAAFIDTDIADASQRRAELVRIAGRSLELEGDGDTFRQVEHAFITFPLRTGSSGSRTVPLSLLIDATPLTREEERELHDIELALKGRLCRTKREREANERARALKERLLYSQLMAPELKRLDALQRRTAPSGGRILPREAA